MPDSAAISALTEVAQGLTTSIEGLKNEFEDYRCEQQRLRHRDMILAGLVLLIVVVGLVLGLLFANSAHLKGQFNQACKKNADVANSTIQFYDTIVEQSQPTLDQLKKLPPKSILAGNITVEQNIQAIEKQMVAIRISQEQLRKVARSC